MKNEKAEKLFELIGDIDEKIIAEAETVKTKPANVISFQPKKHLKGLILVASIAFIVVTVGGIAQILNLGSDESATSDMAALAPEADEELHESELDYMVEEDSEDQLYFDRSLKYNPEFADITLNVTINDSILNGLINNHSQETINPSHPYLEYFNGHQWQYVQTIDNLDFDDIGWIIPPGEVHEFQVNLDWYIIPEGYPLRLRKTVWPDGSFPSGWNQTYLHHDLIYEFELLH